MEKKFLVSLILICILFFCVEIDCKEVGLLSYNTMEDSLENGFGLYNQQLQLNNITKQHLKTGATLNAISAIDLCSRP